MHPQQPGPSGQPQYQFQQPAPPGPPVQQGQQIPPGPPGPPGFAAPPPKKKSRAGCIIAAVLVSIPVGLICLVAAGYFYWKYQHVNEPVGSEPLGVQMIPECDLLRADTLKKLHVTNFSSGTFDEDVQWADCFWAPTKGKDGTNDRDLHIQINGSASTLAQEQTEDAEAEFDYQRESTKATRINDIEGPWDEAFLAGDTSTVEGLLVFRKGTKVVGISYDGTDKSYGLEDTGMPIDEAEQGAKAVALEIAPKL
ncbi:hypothetical protein [Saccharopolyspora shandongensis]|uniref:hypothetical protein n=1 Tax=Saccharopolyspora shandongensis TaxID=418495 RepID=UPI000B84F9D3|nr:hypothetical protein [Saccharopolyspora shandongensis]